MTPANALQRAGEGQATTFAVVMFVTLLLFCGLVLDGGLALATTVRLYGDADAAARAGAQQLDLVAYRTTGRIQLDPAGARAAAYRLLARAGDKGQVTVTGDQVAVTTAATVPTHLLAIAGLGHIDVHATGTAHPVRGIT